MARSARDPKQIITPDAFSVAPELLGTPLARPWRRAGAMAIDLLAIVLVARVGWVLIGLAIALLFFRRAIRPAAGALTRGARWLTYGSLATLALAASLFGAWLNWFGGDAKLFRIEAPEAVVASDLGSAVAMASGAIALARAETEQETREAASDFALSLNEQGLGPEEIREVLLNLAADKDTPWARDAVLAALEGVQPARLVTAPDSLALAYAAAIQAGDSAGAASLRAPLVEAVAGDRLARQQARIERLRDENEKLQEELDEERDKGLLKLLFRAADEIGIGFGWAGLYFTFFLVVWRGRTPGKRLMHIRVVQLDGRPIGWWMAFNRFGGYAASIFTGLLGFFEMFWDPNRQALHDRIASTVVIHESRGGRNRQRLGP